jgi:hypothetical protein
MPFPEVEIHATDSIHQAERKVEKAISAKGGALLAYDNLNTILPTSSFCHFFQTQIDGRECVITVMAAPWEEKTLLTVLNVLLNIRLDPDPPGQTPLFLFYGAHPLPPVLHTLFGDTPLAEFECRAALVARFATELLPSHAFQLAAVGMHLLREQLGVKTSFFDQQGEDHIGKALAEDLGSAALSDGGAPLNALITLGFLYGEILRARVPHPSRWIRLKESSPWPVIVFGNPDKAPPDALPGDGDEPPAVESHAPAAEGEEDKGAPQVVFSPIASLLSAYQDKSRSRLAESSTALLAKCGAELGE